MYDAIADRVITIKHPSFDVVQTLKAQLEWTNPDYVKRIEAGRSTWGCPRTIALWQRAGEDLIVPFGMLPLLWKMGLNVEPTVHLKVLPVQFSGEVEGLYPYQAEAVESALKAKQGVLVAPCGSGKTQIGIAICARLGLRTLWLTHTHELLKQSKERAEQYLNCSIGTITGGKVNASNGITFATVQTMSKIDPSTFHNFWDVIIVDECHRCVGTPTQMTMFWKVLSLLSARYKFGLTATPKRSDGMEKAMYALLGPKFHEISKEQVKESTCPLNVIEPIPTGWMPDYEKVLNPDGTLNYTNLITDCIESESRNQYISNAINAAASDGATLVLSERVAHLEKLSKMCDYKTGNLSNAKKSERKDLRKKVNSGEIRVLFATYAMAKEGLDMPCLKHLVMASPVKDDIAVTQSAGRVMRAYPDKEFGTLWDFEDDMPMLKKWLKKRLSIYKKVNA